MSTSRGLVISCLILLSYTSSSSSEPVTPTAPGSSTSPERDGQYFEADDDILTSKGEITIDFETNQLLPEQLDDGELEKGDRHTTWTYLDQARWSGEYPECKGLKLRQSPIDIITDKVVFGPNMRLEFVDYDQEVEFEIKNTHHSVSLTPIPSISKPTLKLNFVPGGEEFELQEIHFHWGDALNKGSEHEINDQRSAAEMHMVHYRKGIDKSQIGSIEDSVVVVGVFIESDSIEHNKLEAIVRKTEYVNGTDLEYKDDSPVNLIDLLPDNHHSFYTYNGSLTTPPCYEVVTWILMSEPVYMSQDRLVELTNMETQIPEVGRRKIARNFRDVQPLQNRSVYGSFNAADTSVYTRLDSIEKQREHMESSGQIAGQMVLSQRVSRALKEYWQKVNSLRGSVRKAFKAIDEARRELWKKIGVRSNKKKGGPKGGEESTVNDIDGLKEK